MCASLSERENAYRELRVGLAQDYDQSVGPRAMRARLREVVQRREAGGRHGATADELERRIEQDCASYEDSALKKWVLAILTGRYDTALLSHGDAGSASKPLHQRALDAACRTRIAEIGK